MSEYYLRDLRLSDTPYLSKWLGDAVPAAAESGRHGRVTQKALRDYVRKLQASPLFKAYAWEREAEAEGEALRGADELSEEPELLALIFCEQTALRNGMMQIEFLLKPERRKGEIEAARLLDRLFLKAGQDPGVKALSLHVPEFDKELIEAAEELPFELAYERYPLGRSSEEREEEWIRLYTLSKTSNWPYTWGFVPTPCGLWAVLANEREVSSLDWLDYEAPIEDLQLKELCIADGFADAYGRLKDRASCEAVPTPPLKRHIPEVLRKAIEELKAYAAGDLKRFSVPLASGEGTRFQRRVWQEISAIPYGSTRSYEDLGIILADGDAEKGRRMTRAVGAACAANPLAVFVPCHRVIAKDKKLQGYAFGVERKDWLLSLEILGLSE